MAGDCRGAFYRFFNAGLVTLMVIFWPTLSPADDNKNLERRLSFYNTHTHEHLTVTYKKGGGYVLGAMKKINYILRDHRSN